MGGRRLLAFWLGAIALALPAHAFPQDHLTAAKEALTAGNKRAAKEALAAAEASFAETDALAPDDVLATFWVYRGLLARMRGRTNQAMDAFREALVVNGEHEWDVSVSDDREIRKIFEALRGEVQGRDELSPGIPEKMGCAVAYVDGSRVRAGDTVRVGRRLAQVQCPHGDVHGVWTSFLEDEPVDWLALCPYPIDTSIEPAVAEESQFGGLDVTFGEPPDRGDDPCIDLLVTPPPVTSTVDADASEEGDASGAGFMARSFGRDSWTTARTLTVGAGGAMVVTGVILHYAVVIPAYDMVEWGRRNPTAITRYQADILTSRFQTRRAAVYSVTAIGAASVATGLLLMRPKSTSLQAGVSPMGFALSGRF